MQRIVCVLFILCLYKYCHGTLTDEWKQHFYQPRRDYSNRTQNGSLYLPKTSENVQSPASFRLLKPKIERQLNQSIEVNIIGVRQSLTQRRSNKNQNECICRRRLIRDSFKNNALKLNEIELKNEDSLRTNINTKPNRLTYFRSRNSRNSKLRNSIGAAYDTTQNENFQAEYKQESQIFSDCCSVTSNVLFIRNNASKSVINDRNSFKGPDYLPPLYKTTIMYKAREYLQPTERPYYPITKITNPPFTKTAVSVSSSPAITPKKPYIPIVTQREETKHYCSTCSSTGEPFHIPVTQPSTPLPSIFETNTYKGEEYDPAKAMQVPAEEEEGTINIITLPPKNDQADMGIPSEEGVELKTNIPRNVTTTFRPVERVNERGDVPDEEESTSVKPAIAITVATKDHFTLTTDVPFTQPTIFTSKTVTTTTKMTLISTDPSITSNKKVPMQTFEDDRHLVEESGPTTQTNTRNTTSFKGLEYLPPDDTTMKITVIPTTPESLEPAPAMAMPVPREPEDTLPIPPPATFTTSPTTTVDTSFMTPGNRHQTEADLPMSTSFSGPEYLPPKEPTCPTATTSSGDAPAMAMPVPPEPKDMPISTSSPTLLTTLTDAFRAPESPYSPHTTNTNFKAPEYLPPKEVISALPPSPAMAIPVSKEPHSKNDPNSTPDIDPRFADTDSCGNKKPTEPFKGPPYLPPSAKTRVKARLIKS